jgi:[acyl-carrier-protein] S-malonyltransferase
MIDWNTTALVFPGQGSQQVGMGADLIAKYPAAAKVFEEADAILGLPFSKLMFQGPATELDETVNTQPALYIHSIAVLRALESAIGGPVRPIAAAGHSLGEFTALTAAGALTFSEGVRLVRQRAIFMNEAGKTSQGGIAAVLGMELEPIREVCREATAQVGRPVVIANDNCPGQVAISGDVTALDVALNLLKERGAKRVLRLAVSVAPHSPLMAPAAESFRQALNGVTFLGPRFPVIGNVSAAPLSTREEIYDELSAQIVASVRWTESMLTLRTMGTVTFIELGSKDVLTGLLKRIDKAAVGKAVGTADAIATLLA